MTSQEAKISQTQADRIKEARLANLEKARLAVKRRREEAITSGNSPSGSANSTNPAIGGTNAQRGMEASKVEHLGFDLEPLETMDDDDVLVPVPAHVKRFKKILLSEDDDGQFGFSKPPTTSTSKTNTSPKSEHEGSILSPLFSSLARAAIVGFVTIILPSLLKSYVGARSSDTNNFNYGHTQDDAQSGGSSQRARPGDFLPGQSIFY